MTRDRAPSGAGASSPTGSLRFSTLTPFDVMAMGKLLQASQAIALGVASEYTLEEAASLAEQPCAWAVKRANGEPGGALIACFGIFEQFPGRHGTGWAMLSDGVGASHLELTRFIRAQAENCGLPRLELLARVPDIEDVLAGKDLDAGQVAEIVKLRPSSEYRWAVLLGFRPMHLVRCYGPLSESYMLCERIAPRFPAMREAA